MNIIHGGDIYRNNVKLDFSVNVNPFGIPEQVKNALFEAVKRCENYPDITAERLKKAVGRTLHIKEESILFGNGASELFLAIVHAVTPNKIVVPTPSFYGYEYAAEASGGKVIYHEWKEENMFSPDETIFDVLTEDVKLLFLANPNNPTGSLSGKHYLKKLLSYCREKEIYVVLDECFIEFCGEAYSLLWETAEFENLIVIRAFTKTFAIPGVRLGYLVCENRRLLERIRRQLPEWNLSCFAQTAGCVCAEQTEFVRTSAAYIKAERKFLTDELCRMGIKVYQGEGNFILFFSELPLYDALLKKGILIRDCKNFRGLSEGFFRIAVKRRKENEILLKEIGELRWRESE